VNPPRIVVVVSVIAALMLAPTVVDPASAAGTRTAVHACSRDYLTVPPVAPARVARPPAGLAIPPGVKAGTGLSFWAMATDSTYRGPQHVGYEVIAAPTGFACAGVGYYEDGVSYATFWSKTNPSHAVTARFGFGQGGFAATCAYLAAAGRTAAASALARSFGMTLAQCRQGTPDLPAAAQAHGVRFRSANSAPFAVIVKAPPGSESTWGHLNANGQGTPGRKTTTPTLSVALTRYIGLSGLASPQSYDCSLAAAKRSICLRGIRAFVAETLITSFRWTRAAADQAGRKVVAAFG
jgi:hypothetical protein